MGDFNKKLIIGIIGYIVLGLLTFGWVYNHTVQCDPDIKTFCASSMHDANAFIAGSGWPIYWTGKFALYITGRF